MGVKYGRPYFSYASSPSLLIYLPCNKITIVGVIVRENQTSTNRNYEVDDGTGVIQVRIWIESDDSSDHIARQLGNVGYAILLSSFSSFSRISPLTKKKKKELENM
jgi:hypothetical protein